MPHNGDNNGALSVWHARAKMAATKLQNHQFSIVIGLFTLAFLIIFGVFGRYSAEVAPAATFDFATVSRNAPLLHDATFFVLAFALLNAFLRRYAFSSIGFTLLLTAFAIEWGLIVRGFFSDEFRANSLFPIGVRSIAKADYTAAVVIISMGALLGKVTPVQHIMIAAVEVAASVLNEYLLVSVLGVGDLGGSLVVHLFGAIFGIAVARILFRQHQLTSEHQGSIYHSDVFSLIGTIVLWALFPSFNSVFALTAAEQQRTAINTFLALVGSTVSTFLFSQLMDKSHHFNVKHAASASLSGGVAIAIVANLYLTPLPAILTGVIAGAASVFSFQKISPAIAKRFNIHDTRGVFSLHGVPAIIGALASVITLFMSDTNVYGDGIRHIYPFARSSTKDGRNPGEQAIMQLFGLGITIVVALVSGLVTGLVARAPFWRQVLEKEVYSDQQEWGVPEDFDFTTRVTSHIERVELTETSERTRLTAANDTPAVAVTTVAATTTTTTLPQ